MDPNIVWQTAILNTLGCFVQELSKRGSIDGAELVACVQEMAAGMRRCGNPDIADAMHIISEHLLKSDEPPP